MITQIRFNSSHTFISGRKSPYTIKYTVIYIQLAKINIMIYNSVTQKGDFNENTFIMLQCRTTNSKFLRRLEPKSCKEMPG